jgi:dihydroorotase-like cyclic amidohydrolase
MATDTELDRLIEGATVVTHDAEFRADIGITGGTIAGLYEPHAAPAAKQVDDAHGLFALPGAIDPHVHLRALGKGFEESCRAVSRQMASGGGTMMIDFTLPDPDGYAPALDRFEAALASSSLIDGTGHPILMSGDDADRIPELKASHGISGFKIFPAGAKKEVHAGVTAVDDGEMWRILSEAARADPPAVVRVHAENWEIVAETEAEVRTTGRVDAAAWTDARPAFAEAETVRRVLYLAEKAKCPVYFVHLTTQEAVEQVSYSPERGISVFAETCPQFLTRYATHPGALAAKVRPAVKAKSDSRALWTGLANDWVHCVGSDHVPVSEQLKAGGGHGAFDAIPGIPGAGTGLPVLLSYGAAAGRLSLSDVVRASSYNAARIFGLLGQKGVLRPGADADIALVDMAKRVKVTRARLHTELTIFEGEKFTGWPVRTYSRGRVVMDDGKLLGEGGGRFVRTATRTAAFRGNQ